MMTSEGKFNLFKDTNLYTTENKIKSFREVQRGWNYGKGNLPNDLTLQTAIELNREAHNFGFMETDAFPGTNGEVMLTIYYRNHYIEFVIEPSRQITFYHEMDDVEIFYQEKLSFENAKTTIMEFSKEIWKSSVYSISNTSTIGDSVGLIASPSKTVRDRTQGFPLLAGIAYGTLAIRSATT